MIDISETITLKARELIEAASYEGITFGFAESLTGGLISSSVVNIPGASGAFKGSVVSYTNDVKENVLGVPAEIIESYNEVSDECAVSMAQGAFSVLGVDIAVSVTGIAGPTGDLPGKPVGTVYMGYCYKVSGSAKCVSGSRRLNYEGDRNTIRSNTVYSALNLVVKIIRDGAV